MEKICYLICAGEKTPLDFVPYECDMVIAVDGGFSQLTGTDISASLIVGDFDSLGYVPEGNVVKLDSVKDVSDTFAAIDEGFRRGYKNFKLYSALGGRLSHTLYNINALNYINCLGGTGEILGNGVRVFTCASSAKIDEGGYMSIYPLTYTAKVEITGCKYRGVFTMTHTDSLGLSNEPQKNAAVKIHSGAVLIILEPK